MILSSNLLSGGIEDRHLPLFSQESKDQLKSFSLLMEDKVYTKNLTADDNVDCHDDTL